MRQLLIERYAEPLSADKNGRPQRGQLYQTIFGEPGEPDVTHKVGSPAPWATVKAHEERIYATEEN
jgi:hypothetical protein